VIFGMNHCSKCGAQLEPSAEPALCPACLLEAGLSRSAQADTLDEVPRYPSIAGHSTEPGSTGRFGEYELLAEIARGGQGVVYRARHRSLNRLVALKMLILGPWATEAHLRRFKTEAEAAANLDHPQIVPIYEIGQVEGQHYFTMKLVEGPSLKQLVMSGPLAPRRAAELLAGAARAIHHAHERGILHRDIKPGNILLDEQGQPQVTDFGLAKLVEDESTVTNTMDVLGTPSYLSPEQATGQAKSLTKACDIYGLGAVFYELLTGNPPFAGGTTMETLRHVVEKEPRRPSLWNPKLDRELETICLKCLQKDPHLRYESAAALAEDLERWLRHEPILARPSGVFTRARKLVRRHPVAAGTIPTATALGAALVLIVWQEFSRKESPPGVHRESLAVVIRAGDTKSAGLSKEFSKELNHLLSGLSGLAVLPRSAVLKSESSAVPAEKLGKALRVQAVLLGQVQQLDENFRLNLELTESANGARRWSRTMTSSPTDWASVQAQIARAVVMKLGIDVNAGDRVALQRPLLTKTGAWFHYLRGRQQFEKATATGDMNAIQEFQAAITEAPGFAEAYVGLAEAHLDLGYQFQEPAVHFALARDSIRKALKLDETLPQAIAVDGALRFFLDWNWAGAEQALDQALHLDPSIVERNACYLHCLQTVGRGEEAFRAVERAVTLSDSISIEAELSCGAYYAGDFAKAEAYGLETLKKDPENYVLYFNMGRPLAQEGRYEEALAMLEKGRGRAGGDWGGMLAEIAYIRARQGRTNESQQIIEELRKRETQLKEFVDPYLYACIYAGLGDADRAFEYLTVALNKKSVWLPSIVVEPKFNHLRNDRRYGEILASMKLPFKPDGGRIKPQAELP
jgi:serine/threonine protein kinase/tetratricopeptide (TPR) repeat protein